MSAWGMPDQTAPAPEDTPLVVDGFTGTPGAPWTSANLPEVYTAYGVWETDGETYVYGADGSSITPAVLDYAAMSIAVADSYSGAPLVHIRTVLKAPVFDSYFRIFRSTVPSATVPEVRVYLQTGVGGTVSVENRFYEQVWLAPTALTVDADVWDMDITLEQQPGVSTLMTLTINGEVIASNLVLPEIAVKSVALLAPTADFGTPAAVYSFGVYGAPTTPPPACALVAGAPAAFPSGGYTGVAGMPVQSPGATVDLLNDDFSGAEGPLYLKGNGWQLHPDMSFWPMRQDGSGYAASHSGRYVGAWAAVGVRKTVDLEVVVVFTSNSGPGWSCTASLETQRPYHSQVLIEGPYNDGGFRAGAVTFPDGSIVVYPGTIPTKVGTWVLRLESTPTTITAYINGVQFAQWTGEVPDWYGSVIYQTPNYQLYAKYDSYRLSYTSPATCLPPPSGFTHGGFAQ